MNPLDASLKGKVMELTDAILAKGTCFLFALLQRKDAEQTWDIVLSSAWTDGNVKDGIEFIAERLKGKLTSDEATRISRIAVVPSNHPFVADITNFMRVEKGDVTLTNCTFNGLKISHAVLFHSQRPE